MTSPINAETLRERASTITWFHSMDLGHGVRTEGDANPAEAVHRLGLPELHGKDVLDVGAWDGFFSFEAERRGAARVLATDSFSWNGGGWGSQEGFLLAREALDSKVEDREIDIMDLSPEAIGTFDVVLCLGVLYHMRDPVGALERVASVTRGQLILETEVGMLLNRRPASSFFPTVELRGDPTNWWAPNPQAVLGMLKAAGFSRAEVAWKRGLAGRLGSVAQRRLARTPITGGAPRTLMDAAQRWRFVFHAWK